MATWTFYNKWKKRQLSTATDFSAGNIQFLLLKAGTLIGGQTPVNAANTGDSGNAFVSDLVPGTNEVTGTNYARTALGTQGLSGPTSGVVTFAGVGITYAQSGAGFTDARYVVLFDNGPGTDATRPVIAVVDLGASVGNVAGALTINTDTGNAVFTLT
jgi:hypothetical protein